MIKILFRLQSMPYYAVAKGRAIGIFSQWHMCRSSITGYKGARYKKFDTRKDAHTFLVNNGVKYYDKDTSDSDDDSSSSVEIVENVKEFWPDDEKCGDDDDEFLLLASAEVEGIPVTSKISTQKRKGAAASGSGSSKSDSKKSKQDCTIWEAVGEKRFGNIKFPIDSEGYVICYTDGSCEGNGQASPVAGYGVYFSDEHPLNVAKPVTGRPTNNVGEIEGSIYAIKIAQDVGIDKLCISTDSQFLINSITLWLKGWKKNGWRTKSGTAVKNKDEFVELDNLLSNKNIKIKWNYVRGHKGIAGNEKADKLARSGAQMYRDKHKIP